MEKYNIPENVKTYFKAVCDAYSLGNVESSYNAPIMDLFTSFGCAARDLSGERKGQTGENIDIKLWHSEEEVTETEPFAGIEVKKSVVLTSVRFRKLKSRPIDMETLF